MNEQNLLTSGHGQTIDRGVIDEMQAEEERLYRHYLLTGEPYDTFYGDKQRRRDNA